MRLQKKVMAGLLLAALGLSPLAAKTVRIANQGDASSMDPHSLNESLQLSLTNNIYEALVGVSKDLKFEPGLASSWRQTSPTVWRFELRRNVRFHDGTAFGADDVVFSLNRAAGDGSDMRSNTNDIKEVRKVDNYTVDIETKSPFPILPNVLSTVYIMSKKWCEDNQAQRPVDRRKGLETPPPSAPMVPAPSCSVSASLP
jgi:peptide/nickel transport system substrate-binding protein